MALPKLDLSLGRIPLTEQLAGSPIPEEQLEQFEKDAEAIDRLRLRGIISAPGATAARQRLERDIERAWTWEGR